MLEVLISTPIYCCLSFMMRIKFKRWVNYVNVVNLMWFFGIITTAVRIFGVYKPTVRVYLYILEMLICFNLVSYLFVKNFRIEGSNFEIKQWIPSRNKIETILLLGFIVIMLPELKSSLSNLVLGGYNLVRGNALTAFTLVQWFLYHYGNPVIIALSVISIVDVIFVGKNKQNLILSFVATLINITIFASRWMLLEFIVILALCLLFRYHFRIISAIRNNRRIFMFIAAGAILLIFITSQRKMSSGNSTILENIYYYFWGSIACMGAHIENVDNYIMYNGHTWGQLYFSGIMGICKDILQPIFHINIRPGIEVLNEVVQGYVYVSPKIRMNNNVTMITAFYFDGGGYAIALFSGMTAWFVARLYNKMNRSGTTNKLAYFIFAYSLLLFGLIEWMPARATNIWVFIIIAIIYRIRRIKIK